MKSQETTIEQGQSAPLLQQVEEFLEYIKRRKSKNTHKNYQNALRCFDEFLSTENISAQLIEQYLQSLLDKGLKAKTVNLHLAAVKSYCRYRADFYDAPNPATKVRKAPECLPPRRRLTEDEYQKLLKVTNGEATKFNERDVSLIKLLANTGIRIGELRTLTLTADPTIGLVVGKGNKRRAIPLNETARSIIESPVFNRLKNLSYRSLHLIIQKACQHAGVMPASPHDFRHFFANRARKHLSTYQISKILGHSSTKVTEMIYFEWQYDEVKGLTDFLD